MAGIPQHEPIAIHASTLEQNNFRMDFISSKRFITITLAILVVLNLALLGTLWWQNTNSPRKSEAVVKTRKYKNKPSIFEKELKLSEEQNKQFNMLRLQHFQKTLPALVAISGLKRQLIQESVKNEPDTLVIKALAQRIGSQQALIEYRLAWHFNELSKVCTPEQRDSLQSVLEKVTAKPYKLKRKLFLKRIRVTPLRTKADTAQSEKKDTEPEKQSEKALQ